MGGFHLYFSPAPTRVLDLSNMASLNLPSLDWQSHGPLSFYSCASEAWVLRDGRAEKRGGVGLCEIFTLDLLGTQQASTKPHQL